MSSDGGEPPSDDELSGSPVELWLSAAAESEAPQNTTTGLSKSQKKNRKKKKKKNAEETREAEASPAEADVGVGGRVEMTMELVTGYNRLCEVQAALALMEEWGIEEANDLRELDRDDATELAATLKKVPAAKLLRCLDFGPAARQSEIKKAGKKPKAAEETPAASAGTAPVLEPVQPGGTEIRSAVEKEEESSPPKRKKAAEEKPAAEKAAASPSSAVRVDCREKKKKKKKQKDASVSDVPAAEKLFTDCRKGFIKETTTGVVNAISEEPRSGFAGMGFMAAFAVPLISSIILTNLPLAVKGQGGSIHAVKATCTALRRASGEHLDALPSMVVIGGVEVDLDCQTPAAICDSMHALKASTGEWLRLPRMPTPRFEMAACALRDGRIFVAGGITRMNGDIEANATRFLDPANGIRNQPANEAGSDSFKGRLSQCGEEITDCVEVFDPAKGSWETLPPLPYGVAGARACCSPCGSRVWVIGGTPSDDEPYCARITREHPTLKRLGRGPVQQYSAEVRDPRTPAIAS